MENNSSKKSSSLNRKNIYYIQNSILNTQRPSKAFEENYKAEIPLSSRFATISYFINLYEVTEMSLVYYLSELIFFLVIFCDIQIHTNRLVTDLMNNLILFAVYMKLIKWDDI